MKNTLSFHSKIMVSLALLVGAFSVCPAVTHGATVDYSPALYQLEKRVGLLESVYRFCGPVTISQVRLGNQQTCLTVRPGQIVDCSLHYKYDASQQKFLNKHHLVVGLEGVAAETCIAHLYGVRDIKGTKQFKLVAPLQEGDYEVRAVYYATDKCEEALNLWNVLKVEPSNSTTIGFLRVRNAF